MKTLITLIFVCVLSLTVVGQSQAPSPDNSQRLEAVKSVADVLDKGVDIMASYVSTVSNVLKSVAPEVWRIMIRQQYAKAASGIALWLILPVVIFSIPFVFRRLMHGKNSGKFLLQVQDCDRPDSSFDTSPDQFRVFFSWAAFSAAFLTSVISVFAITYYVQVMINPEYYAIKDILEMVK